MSSQPSDRILIVDDNPAIHEDFRKLLAAPLTPAATYRQAAASLFGRPESPEERPSLVLECALQGPEGLAKVRQAIEEDDPYAMAFVDMRMPPGWDGLETISRFWQVQPELLVVICTAFADYSWQEMHQRLGRSDRFLILKKPFDNVEVRQLASSLTARARTERRLNDMQRQLLDASRQAGMAEVATSVLHNVGNVLNSLNVSCTLACDQLSKTRIPLLRKCVGLLREHQTDLPAFLTADSKGKALPEYLEKLSGFLEDENAKVLAEMQAVSHHVEHIKQIVTAQQSYGKMFGVTESFDPRSVVEQAIRINEESFERHQIAIVREFPVEHTVTADRHKMLQILVNLLRNAKQSIMEAVPPTRRVNVRVQELRPGWLGVAIQDTGMGISPENQARIFQHGFTTKKGGHGFGLHASVLSAREMKGDLTFHSEGVGTGAVFTLELPLARSVSPAADAAARAA